MKSLKQALGNIATDAMRPTIGMGNKQRWEEVAARLTHRPTSLVREPADTKEGKGMNG